jgi:hypothetical protein
VGILIEKTVERRSPVCLLKVAYAKSGLPNHVCDVTICRVRFCEVTVLADLICSLTEENVAQRTISARASMFEPFFGFCRSKSVKLSLPALLNSVAKKPYEHYQEHQIANDVSSRGTGLIGGLVTRIQAEKSGVSGNRRT